MLCLSPRCWAVLCGREPQSPILRIKRSNFYGLSNNTFNISRVHLSMRSWDKNTVILFENCLLTENCFLAENSEPCDNILLWTLSKGKSTC